MERVFNFAAGPAAMPEEALAIAQKELLCYGSTGMSVMEMSHRSKAYQAIFDKTEGLVRDLMHIPEDYSVMFLQGGATGQFAAVAMNLIGKTGKADYVDSGNFAHGAMVEAKKYGEVKCVASTEASNYTSIPTLNKADFTPDASYFYITTNNTIFGTRYSELPDTGDVPLVADMSSNILSEVYDVKKFGAIIAGAQKNIGPAGFAIVIADRKLFGHALPCTPSVLDWKIMDKKGSMLNTPPTYAIYMAGLCLEWLKNQGGVEAIEQVNIEKAKVLYDVIDNSDFYRGAADPASRSRMNVTFFSPSAELDAKFVAEATASGLANLKGHRLVNGMRASIYNSMPMAGVKALAEFMKKFEMENK